MEDIIRWIVAGFFAITAFMEVCAEKSKPWSWLLRRVGEVMNKDLNDKIDDISKRFENHAKDDECDKARLERSRIITFAGEARRGIPHTKEHYDVILDDIGRYRLYCEQHKDFPNNVADQSMAYIESRYAKHMEEDSFLK